ncbi:MAG TPA: ABC transporter permease, partial [Fimbriimonadaceae bacterium]|nr:ABC transporter permease [Fimbriimonadaceae bacterium]
MNIFDQFGTALRALAANKLRSMLTMLGVVIGIGSVIAMIGIGEGTKRAALANIQRMGTNMLMVWPNWRRGNVSGSESSIPTLKDEDVRAIRRNVPLATFVSGTVGASANLKYKDHNHVSRLVGGEPQIAIIQNATRMIQGGWFTPEDDAVSAKKCVLGYVAYQELFGNENAVGANIRIKNDTFEVLGVIDYKGGTGMWNPDDQVYVPLSTARRRLMGQHNLDGIVIQASDPDLMILAQKQVEDTLDKTRKNSSSEPLFRVMNQGDALDQMKTQNNLLSILLAGIASVSLLVGGIGIMNIMLVSVTERTREIGLRKAIGARRETILSQFLLESVAMCCVGGLIGILVGVGGVFIVSPLLKVPAIVNVQAIVL